jgi:hypothetical protein
LSSLSDRRTGRNPAPIPPAQVARARLKAFAGQAVKDLQQDKKAAAQGLKKLVQLNS